MEKLISLKTILSATHGKLISTQSTEFSGIGTDTRENLLGKLFVALKGESYDAHQFLNQAVEKGATGLIVSDLQILSESYMSKITVIKVEDTLDALQKLGRERRRQSSARIIGITGSNGKTTSKEYAAALLSRYFKVHFNQGSFNNHWGVPLTLLGIQPEHQVVISEMGMNHPGELTQLAQIGEPDIVVVTTVGRAHLEGLGSLEAVAKAKEEIYFGTKPQATRIFNLDNPYTREMLQNSWKHFPEGKILSFSSQDDGIADVRMKIKSIGLDFLQIKGDIQGVEGEVRVPVFGTQNLTNIMVAASIGLALGLMPKQIWDALPECKSVWGRNQLLKIETGTQVIFDGYNANPDSMKALMENMKRLSKDKEVYVILGEMKELGTDSQSLHVELGRIAGDSRFRKVWFAGPSFANFEKGFKSISDSKNLMVSADFDSNLIREFRRGIEPEHIIAIKGSRGMKMERFLKALNPIGFLEK